MYLGFFNLDLSNDFGKIFSNIFKILVLKKLL